MKTTTRLVLKALTLLLAAASAIVWANSLMNSLYSYRSPFYNLPPIAGPPLGQSNTRRVVLVLVDGLRYDTSVNAKMMPFLSELKTKGAWAKMHSRPPSYSESAYTVLFTGAWPDLNDGPTINMPYEDIRVWTQDDLFSAAARSGLRTAVSGYYWFEKLVPQKAINQTFYTPGEDRAADRQVVDAALPWLKSGEEQLVLIHLDQVDYAGHHEGGASSLGWDAAAKRSDDLLGEIAQQLDLSRDTLVVVSDHGHLSRGGHGGQDAMVLQEPFLLVGAGVKPGEYGDVSMVDLAPTLAALLGVNLPASSQGRPRTEMLALDGEKSTTIENAFLSQQNQLLTAYQAAIGQTSSPSIENTSARVYQARLESARQARLNRERLPRLLIGIAWLLAPIILFFWKFNRDRGWMLLSGLIYLVLFNLGYAVVGGRTYSLSSVNNSMELILFTGGLTIIALALSGLLFAWLIKVRQYGRRAAGEAMLNFALVACYLLSIPVLINFVLNGALVTWTLPEFSSSFLGFLSLIQILFASLCGLILAGLASVLPRRHAPAVIP
jgi:hypothetical protein